MEAAHLLPAADVLRHFSVTAEGGLSPAQVTSARERYGPNGESAGRAGASGAARTAVFVPPPPPPRIAAAERQPHPSSWAPAGGQETRAPETSADAPGTPNEAARSPSRRAGSGFGGGTPGSPSRFPPVPGTCRALPNFPPPAWPDPLLQALATPSAVSDGARWCRCRPRGRLARGQRRTLRLSPRSCLQGLPRGLNKTPRRCSLSAGSLGAPTPTPKSSSFCNPRRMWLAGVGAGGGFELPWRETHPPGRGRVADSRPHSGSCLGRPFTPG